MILFIPDLTIFLRRLMTMRFPIQFNLSLVRAGLSADERRAIRESIATNIQNYQTVQSRLERYGVALPNILKSKVDVSSIYRANHELQFYNQHGYTEFESQQYNAIIDDLITIGVYGVEPETLNKLSDNDYGELEQELGYALRYNELYTQTGDERFGQYTEQSRARIIEIVSKYV